tara:strand:- start:483 stop:827 length:345 start_codon:yes stop_codon:yes gene_type:complete
MNIDTDIIDIPMWEILHSPITVQKEKRIYSIKSFNESLKKTFVKIWENKIKWMQLIKIFKILDTFHFFNLMEIYNTNIKEERSIKINNYLLDIKGYNKENLPIFMKAFDNYFLQ